MVLGVQLWPSSHGMHGFGKRRRGDESDEPVAAALPAALVHRYTGPKREIQLAPGPFFVSEAGLSELQGYGSNRVLLAPLTGLPVLNLDTPAGRDLLSSVSEEEAFSGQYRNGKWYTEGKVVDRAFAKAVQPALEAAGYIGWKKSVSGSNAEYMIYDPNERLAVSK